MSSKNDCKKNGYQGSGIDCPRCQQTASFKGYRAKTLVSILGTVRCERGYYYCGHGVFPWDQFVGLTPRAVHNRL